MTSTHPAVRLHGLRKAFGTITAVDGITLDLDSGSTVALLGPNGAGKSTTIAMLLGLQVPDAGTVRVFEQDPDQAVRAGLVGAMPQEGGTPNRVTVTELIRFVGSAYPKTLPMAEILAAAHLTEVADRRVDRLSGGQRQRVRFAMAIAGNPDLIVLDEPTAALDVSARREFWDSMRRFAERGTTILFSTHYLEEADEHADRVIVIDRGRVVADGTSDEVKRTVPFTTVSIRVDGPVTHLAGLPGVAGVEVRGDHAVLRTRDADATVTALAAAGAIRDISISRGNLEAAFLALTSHDPAIPSQPATDLATDLAIA
jgi:ABC-2 type transport system ATP-binding protein